MLAHNTDVPLESLRSSRTGAGGLLDATTSVQRRVPLEGETELREYDELSREFEAGQRDVRKRLRP